MFLEYSSYFIDMELGFQHVFEGIRDDAKEVINLFVLNILTFTVKK